jgi:hypothetical protein
MMRHANGAAVVLTCLSALIAPLSGQPPVNPRQMYERIMVVVPLVGTGTLDDPKRPMYAPAPSSAVPAGTAASTPARTGIIAFTHVLSDDGKVALCEFVARDRSAFNAILADPTAKSFAKGVHSRADAEAEFKKYKKDFDIDKFGVHVR